MSTPCLTMFKSAEMDDQTMQEVACLWRRFDGYPDTHLAELKRDLTTHGRGYLSIMDLISEKFPRLLLHCPPEFKWQYVPVNRTEDYLFPCYIYEVWLEYQPR